MEACLQVEMDCRRQLSPAPCRCLLGVAPGCPSALLLLVADSPSCLEGLRDPLVAALRTLLGARALAASLSDAPSPTQSARTLEAAHTCTVRSGSAGRHHRTTAAAANRQPPAPRRGAALLAAMASPSPLKELVCGICLADLLSEAGGAELGELDSCAHRQVGGGRRGTPGRIATAAFCRATGCLLFALTTRVQHARSVAGLPGRIATGPCCRATSCLLFAHTTHVQHARSVAAASPHAPAAAPCSPAVPPLQVLLPMHLEVGGDRKLVPFLQAALWATAAQATAAGACAGGDGCLWRAAGDVCGLHSRGGAQPGSADWFGRVCRVRHIGWLAGC